MMHLDNERLQRLLHGELAPVAEASVRDHLAICTDCRSRAMQAELEEERVFGLLRQVDHPPPSVDASAIAARAGRGTSPWARRAASVLLALAAAGVAYAAPGSPLPAWIVRMVAPMTPEPQQQMRPNPEESDVAAGIAVAPGARLTILFTAEQADGLVRVSLVDRNDVAVRAVGGTAAFTSSVDRLSIENSGGSASFEIEIPRTAPWVEIRGGSRRLFLKDRSRVTAEGRQDADGSYVLEL